jgi:hypothetical protein
MSIDEHLIRNGHGDRRSEGLKQQTLVRREQLRSLMKSSRPVRTVQCHVRRATRLYRPYRPQRAIGVLLASLLVFEFRIRGLTHDGLIGAAPVGVPVVALVGAFVDPRRLREFGHRVFLLSQCKAAPATIEVEGSSPDGPSRIRTPILNRSGSPLCGSASMPCLN